MPFGPQKVRKLKQVAFQITHVEHQILRDFATARQVSLSELFRRILEDTIDSWIKGGVIPSPNKITSYTIEPTDFIIRETPSGYRFLAGKYPTKGRKNGQTTNAAAYANELISQADQPKSSS
jgi:hypothetical protein